MTIPLRQSTASQEIPLGYFVDSTNGNTEETGLSIVNTDIKLWKAGATTLANKNSGGATHMGNGLYYSVLDATDTGTLGGLIVFVHESGALPVRTECVVYPANVYDSFFSTDKLQVDATTDKDAILADLLTMKKTAAGTYDRETDSQEAIRDRGDAAWTTGAGGSAPTVGEIRAEMEGAGYKLALIEADTTTDIPASIAALNDVSVANIISGISDGSLDLQEILRVILAATAGKSAGGGTATITFRDSADAKNRITATVDANGNRTAMTLDGV